MSTAAAAISVLACALLCGAGHAFPVGGDISDTNAMIYLSQFGYINKSLSQFSSGYFNRDQLSTAIADFQSFAGLNITGELDEETKATMSLPRCGVKDRIGYGASSRSKRYALQGSRWRVKSLKYRISKYPSNLNHGKVDRELARAFGVWSDYTDLTFTQVKSGSEQVHIDIRFEKGEHGDGDPFDGPGGTLAHAYFPVYGGDAHFDDAEHWTIDSYRGTNLFQVAAHEFGHSLGLSHSDVKTALMAPFYRGYEPSFTLDADDILGIQKLYGKKTRGSGGSSGGGSDGSSSGSDNTPKQPKVPTASGSGGTLCKNASVDTIFRAEEDTHYVFKGDLYWKLTDDGVAAGYPRKISDSWQGLPGDIDAAFTYRNGKTYFFKGPHYWRYVGKRMDGDYPKLISEGFTGIPDNIDAAVVWTGNGKIYFYKGTKFWKFDPAQRPPVKSIYPKPISNWEGIPNNIDTATVYHGYTYFFKNGQYWRFDDRSFAVDNANPKFPRPTSKWWFGCKGELVDGNNRVGGEERPQSERDSEVGDSDLDAAKTAGRKKRRNKNRRARRRRRRPVQRRRGNAGLLCACD
ncbi:matrix metalloproteinase-24 isoform X2 [Schistocerca nitens]|uniref:matrix metalloproteinase-24 isoform X2 n=1 Tax=Schistocerca nitens TaxID=7011 RepID=UPI002118852F|nr:matrix metalloproteinase-24 isoform X2 [Schistocerca nitens]